MNGTGGFQVSSNETKRNEIILVCSEDCTISFLFLDRVFILGGELDWEDL